MSSGKKAQKKRKVESSNTEEGKEQLCVIHWSESKLETFTHVSAGKDSEGRLRKLKDVCNLRQSQPAGSSQRMDEACALLPDTVKDNHGYHRDCYQRFTANIQRLHAPSTSSEPAESLRLQKSRATSGGILFNADCIFCNKEGYMKVKKKGVWTIEGTIKFQSNSLKSVAQTAESIEDETLMTRIRGFDLFAVEAQFQPTCRKVYMRESDRGRSQDEKEKQLQAELEEAHQAAFSYVGKVIDHDIVHGKGVWKLSDLRQLYIMRLEDTKFQNAAYRGEKLKAKL